MAEVHRIGFTGLHVPGSNDATKGLYRVNIVMIHGLRGHPKDTWETDRVVRSETTAAKPRSRGFRSLFRTAPSASTTLVRNDDLNIASRSVFWPKDFLTQDIPEARVWTYGYDADVIGGLFQANNQNSVSQHGRDLAVKIEREIDNKDPLLFVAHSLGGVILKDAIHKSEVCRSRTKLIIFLGTPHRGSLYAPWGMIAANLAQLAMQDTNRRILEALEVNSEVLDNIHEEFKTLVLQAEIKIHSFQESQGLAGMRGLDRKVVDDFSSKLDLPRRYETVESMNANHRQMAKCSNRSDSNYRAILGVLKQVATPYFLGHISSSMVLRERRKIPYLTWTDWYRAITLIGETWGADARVGLDRIGTYSESWMNMLKILGAESILTAGFIHELPMDEDDALQDHDNLFAIDLQILVNLVGIIGCDVLEYVDDLPLFTSFNSRLEFRTSGSNAWIGRFTQWPSLPTHMDYSAQALKRASLYASGCTTYKKGGVVSLVESQAGGVPPGQLLQDLQLKAAGDHAFEYQGLRIPALALLAGDSPVTSRVFPTESSKVLETVRVLSGLCPFWSKEANRTVPYFTTWFTPVTGNISAVLRDEFRSMVFVGDRIDSRGVTRTARPKFIALGFSWLATRHDYVNEASGDRRIKSRPDWPSGDAAFMALEDALLTCDTYLRSGDTSLLYGLAADRAYFDTCLSCQLQEVDWWLDANQAIAASETLGLLSQMSSDEENTITRSEVDQKVMVLATERRVVRAMLVFRAILIAARFGLGLDNSDFESTELGNKIVFLR